MMNLEQLHAAKLQAVTALLTLVTPHMGKSAQLRNADGSPKQYWAKCDANGVTESISMPGCSLPPVWGVSAEGVILNGYGSAYTRAWQDLSLEDVLRLTEVARAVIVPAVVEVPRDCDAWTVESLDVMDRHRTMARISVRQHYANGTSALASFALRGPAALMDLFKVNTLKTGKLANFLAELRGLGHEVKEDDVRVA